MKQSLKQVRPPAPAVRTMVPYDPKYMPARVLLSANECPLNLPSDLRCAIVERIQNMEFNRYPDPLATSLRHLLAQAYGLEDECVLLGNGGDELLFDLFLAWGGPQASFINFPPTFSTYETNARLTGTKSLNFVRNKADASIDVPTVCKRLGRGDIDIVILTNPNNPTGTLTPLEDIRALAEASDALVLVDEAYGEFSATSALPLIKEYANVLILHTFSKAYRAAGVRLGFLLGQKTCLAEFRKVRQPYSVNALSQIVGIEIVKNRSLFNTEIAATCKRRDALSAELAAIEGIVVYPSQANFIFFSVKDTGVSACELWQRMYDEAGVLVRNWSGNLSFPEALRVTVGTRQENAAFLTALKNVLAG